MDTVTYLLGVPAAVLLVAVCPMIYEQAASEPVRQDAAYWEERGYEEMYDVRSTMYDVESTAGEAREEGGER